DTGRIASRSDTATGSTNWTWGYDSGSEAIGKLTSVTGSDGTVLGYGYNALGQLSMETATVGGLTFTAETTYDSAGRVDLYRYPPDPTHVGTRFITKNSYYAASGELQSIARVDASGANPTTLWTATNADALGRVQQETYGNGVQSIRTFDPVTAHLTA